MKHEVSTSLGRMELMLNPNQQKRYKDVAKAIKRDWLRLEIYDAVEPAKYLTENGIEVEASARGIKLDLTSSILEVAMSISELVDITHKTITGAEIGPKAFVRYACYCEHMVYEIRTRKKYNYFNSDTVHGGARLLYDIAGVMDTGVCAPLILSAANGLLTTKTWPLAYSIYSRERMAFAVSLVIAGINGMVDWEKCRLRDKPDELTPDERLELVFQWWEKHRTSLKPLLKAIDFMSKAHTSSEMWKAEKKCLNFFVSECDYLIESFLDFFDLPECMGKYTELTHPVARNIVEKYGDKYNGFMIVMCDGRSILPFGFDRHSDEGTNGRSIPICGLAQALKVEIPEEYREEIIEAFAADFSARARRMYHGIESRIKDEEETAEAAIRERDRANDKMEGLREVNRKQKADLKKTIKERDDALSQITKLKKKLENQAKMLMSGEGLPSTEEVRQLQSQTTALETKVQNLISELAASGRDTKRAQAEVERLEGELVIAGEEKQAIQNRLDAANKIVEQHNSIQGIAKTPLECYIEALKPYKLILIGGEKCHSQLNQWGLSIRTVGTQPSKLRNQDVAGADLVIFMTVQVSHATVYSYKDTANNCGVPIMYCNAHTADDVVLEVFNWIYNPSNTDIVRKRK